MPTSGTRDTVVSHRISDIADIHVLRRPDRETTRARCSGNTVCVGYFLMTRASRLLGVRSCRTPGQPARPVVILRFLTAPAV